MGEIIQLTDKTKQRQRISHSDYSKSVEANQKPELEDKTGAWSEADINHHKELLLNLMKYNEFSKAKIVAKHLTDLQPEDSYAWYLRGVVHLELSDPEQAESCLLRSIEISGMADPWDCEKMSHARLLQGDLDGAVDWCTKALDMNPDEARFRWRLIEIHTVRGDMETAIAVGKEALKKTVGTPEEVRARLALAKLYHSTSAFDQAEGQLDEALKLEDDNSQLWSLLGDCLERQKKTGKALEAYQKSAELDPGNPYKLYNIGDTFLAIGKSKEAIEPLQQTIRLKHDYSSAHYDLSLAYLGLKNYQEAEKSARTALRYDEDTAYKRASLGIAAMENLGIALTKQGRFEEAEECFRHNLGHVKLTYWNLGLMFFWMKRFNDALENFRRALELDPKNPEYHNLLGDTYEELGQLDEAEKYLRGAIEADKNYSIGHCDLGVFLSRRRGQKEEALAAFEQALRIDPNMDQAYYGIACTYALSHEEELALQSLEKALRKGFREFDHIEKDADWDRFRTNDKFIQLLGKYRDTEMTTQVSPVSVGGRTQ